MKKVHGLEVLVLTTVLLSLAANASATFTLKFSLDRWVGDPLTSQWIAQLDEDPPLEVVTITSDDPAEAWIYDCGSGAAEFTCTVQAWNSSKSACSILDVDADGLLEVVVCAGNGSVGGTAVIDTTAPVTATTDPDDIAPGFGALQQNFPNPFNPVTTIDYTLMIDGTVSLNIYDIQGRRIRTLTEGQQKAGQHSLQWDGKDERGSHVASGQYFYQLEVDGNTQSKKMLLIK